jgi:hypothetical protein
MSLNGLLINRSVRRTTPSNRVVTNIFDEDFSNININRLEVFDQCGFTGQNGWPLFKYHCLKNYSTFCTTCNIKFQQIMNNGCPRCYK